MKEVNGRSDSTVTSSSTAKDGLFAKYKEKFSKEAQNLSKLKHPHIVDVLEFFEENNTCYYVMAYLTGGDLDALIAKEGRLSEETAITYAHQIGLALQCMHRHKMLHLDLKPKNVMLDADKRAVLIDFGLSKQYDVTGEPESSTSVGRGTPGYAPLEQANYQDGHGFPVVMDVYALGATLYKMLTGRRAPDASVILNEGFPEEIFQELGISPKLTEVVKKSMSPLRKGRYQSINLLLEALGCSTTEAEDTVSERGFDPKEDHVESLPPNKNHHLFGPKAIAIAMVVCASILILPIFMASSRNDEEWLLDDTLDGYFLADTVAVDTFDVIESILPDTIEPAW